MDPMGMVLRDYVTPLLAANGFTKTGATYRLVGGNGDQVLIGFQRSSSSTPEWLRFYVNLAAVPLPFWEYIRSQRTLRQPGYDDGVLRCRLHTDVDEAGFWLDPRSAKVRPWEPGSGPRMPWSSGDWLVRGVEGVAVCGRVLAAALRDEAVPLLSSLLDRRAFLARLRNQESSFPSGTSVATFAALFLLIDDGTSDELEAQIARVEAWEVEHPNSHSLVAWARQRMAARARDERRGAAAEDS